MREPTPTGPSLDVAPGPETLLSDQHRGHREARLRRLPGLLRSSLLLVWASAPRPFLISSTLQLLAGVATGAQLLFAREVLRRLLEQDPDFGSIVPSLAGLMGMTGLMAFANVARVEQQRLLGELVARHTYDLILGVSTAVDLLEFERPAFHNRLQRAASNASGRPMQMVTGLIGSASAGFALVGIAGALFVIEPVFVALVFVAYLPVLYTNSRGSRLAYEFSVAQTERDRRRLYLFSILTRREEAAEVRAFQLGGFLRGEHRRLHEERIVDLRGVVRGRLALGLAGSLVTSVLGAAILVLLVWLATTGRVTVAEAGAAAAAILLLGQRLQLLSSSTGTLYESSLFVEDLTRFLRSTPDVPSPRATGPAALSFDRIAVSDVSFTYPSRAEPSLRSVSLDIQAGTIVALVGENGSGKTTLAKVLAGLYPPDQGTVRWDDVDVGQLGEQVRRNVGVIFQDFVRYQLTVHQNIATGDHTRFDDVDAVRAASKVAGADAFLSALPKGYDTLLGSQFFGGSDLSIGQWQRLALARAVFRNAPLLILDEPTAALDPRAEADLFESMRVLYRGRTVLLISHRFSSVRPADHIYVLDDGAIIEHGTHDVLMERGGKYAELFTLQAAAYLDPLA